jgi:hypothetical protein
MEITSSITAVTGWQLSAAMSKALSREIINKHRKIIKSCPHGVRAGALSSGSKDKGQPFYLA